MDERTYGPLLGLLIVIPVVAIVAWLFLSGRKLLMKWSENDLHNILEELNAASEPVKGYVNINVPTYVGALFTCTEYRVNVWVPKQAGFSAVKKLLLLSMKYGLVTIWMPWVLFNLFINLILALPKLHAPHS